MPGLEWLPLERSMSHPSCRDRQALLTSFERCKMIQLLSSKCHMEEFCQIDHPEIEDMCIAMSSLC